MDSYDIILNPSQEEALIDNEAIETFYLSGLGGGKTFGLGHYTADKSSVVGSLGLLGAPTSEVLKDSTFPQVQEAWEKLGIYEKDGNEGHYVVNIRPPAEWNVKVLTKLSSNKVVTFKWGSWLKMDGLKDFNKKRGTQFDYMAIDEFRDIDPKARDVLIGRIRGVRFKALRPHYAKLFNDLKRKLKQDPGNKHIYAELLKTYRQYQQVKHQILYATTPPDNPLYLIKLHEKSLTDENIKFIFGSSWENKDNLPNGYIEMMISRYDENTKAREIYGKLITLVQNQYAYKWDKSRHVRAGMRVDMTMPVWLSFDFNKDPMTVVAIQSDYMNYIRILKEFRIKNGDVVDACAQVKAYFDDRTWFCVTGDPAGSSGSALIKGNAYDIIENSLGLDRRNDFYVPKKALELSDSRILLNSILENLGEFSVDYDMCPYLIEDFQFVETDTSKNGRVGINKSGKNMAGIDNEHLTHLLDCVRYFLQAKFLDWLERPIRA